MSGITRDVGVFWYHPHDEEGWTVEYRFPEDKWDTWFGTGVFACCVTYEEAVASVLANMEDTQIRADLLHDMARFEAYKKIL